MKIAHIADIHIVDKRRKEYDEVFDKLYQSLRQQAPDIIAILGDVFDSKTRISANNIQDAVKFLKNLIDIAPVILIPGNHDMNTLVKGSLDLLTPVITDHIGFCPPRFHYLRHSGKYTINNIDWYHIAYDGLMPEIDEGSENFKVCLFHEEVKGARYNNGIEVTDAKLTKVWLDQFDLALGGHIHLHQVLIPNKCAYPGSLIQQNIGEPHNGHGYLMWTEVSATSTKAIANVRSFTMTLVPIENDETVVKIMIDQNGNDVTEQPIPKTPRYWELNTYYEYDDKKIEELVSAYSTKFSTSPRSIGDLREIKSTLNSIETEQICDDKIIRKLLSKYSEDMVTKICELHHENIKERPIINFGKIRLLKLEFNDLYCYGQNNAIDFTLLENSISGLIAPNFSGKSSLIDIILYACYEKYQRAEVKGNIINTKAKSFSLRLDFEYNGKKGHIIKSNDTGKTLNYSLEYGGENLTQSTGMQTVKEIEALIGTFDNAIKTSFILQEESTNIISMSPLERRKFLSSILNLGNYEKIEEKIKMECLSTKKEIQTIEKMESININQLKHDLNQLQGVKNFTDITGVKEKLKDINREYFSILSKYKFDFNKTHEFIQKNDIVSNREKILGYKMDPPHNNLLHDSSALESCNKSNTDLSNVSNALDKSSMCPSKEDVETALKMVSEHKDISLSSLDEFNPEVIKDFVQALKFSKTCKACLSNRQIIDKSEIIEKVHASYQTINMYESYCKQYNSYIKQSDEKLKKFAEDYDRIQILEEQRIIYEQKIANHTEKVTVLKEKIEQEEKRITLLNTIKERLKILEVYKVIIGPKGISEYLIKNELKNLEFQINNNLKEMGATFSINIAEDFSITHTTTKSKLPISLASGYQKFAFNLASRITLWQIAKVPLLNTIIIDEGFGSCDEKNLHLISEMISLIPGKIRMPKLLLIVSHLDILKVKIEKPLTISIESGISKIQNTEYTFKCVRGTPGKIRPKESISKEIANSKEIDSNFLLTSVNTIESTMTAAFGANIDFPPSSEPGKVICTKCNAIICKSYIKKHCESKKHNK